MSTSFLDPPPPPPPDPADRPIGPPSTGEVIARMAEFAQLTAGESAAGPTLQFLQDVPVTITARLGQLTLPIGEILRLGPGAILELDRDVSQPVELTVRGMVFARGEVVVVDGHFAIRIKELMQPRSNKGSR